MRRFPCPCRGCIVFDEPPGSYDIRRICFWEDDPLQLEYATTLAGGADGTILEDAQRDFVAVGACEERFIGNVRPPTDIETRDPEWRPIDLSLDHFETWGDPSDRRPETREEALYYWRATFRQRNYNASP